MWGVSLAMILLKVKLKEPECQNSNLRIYISVAQNPTTVGDFLSPLNKTHN